MLTNLRGIFRFYFLWVLFFAAERLVFLLVFIKKIKILPFGEVLKSFLFGLWIDASTAGYFLALPLVIILLQTLIHPIKARKAWICIYFRTLAVLCSLITVINFNIYREWGTKVNRRAFEFLVMSPGEAIASSVSSPLFMSFLILFLLIALGFFLSKKAAFAVSKDGKWYFKLLLAIPLLALNFLAIRGGWQLAPMNESKAYYSSTPILNHAAVNTEWSLLHSLMSGSKKNNPYPFFKPAQAEAIVNELYPVVTAPTTSILATSRPNVILIIMESFTADVIESLGGEKGINPGTERLIKEGILFKNIYASGDRTDKGVVAVLSAFPTQGSKSIMKESEKHPHMISLYKVLKLQGYKGTFYYGGETEFANMKSYLLNTGCEELVDKSDFDQKDMNSKWGAYDNVVYDRLLKDALFRKQPFFNVLLTLTNHEPFELPVASRFPGEEIENKFRSTAYFADSCLAAFADKAKKQSWYKNTIFIVVADHGHRLPENKYEIYDSHRYRIPLLAFGGALKPEFRGKQIEKVGSQTDIAASLLAQLQLSSRDFLWSKDLLNEKVAGSAFYSWDGGFGFVNSDNKALTFDNMSQSVVYRSAGLAGDEEKQSLDKAKACMQKVYQEYLKY